MPNSVWSESLTERGAKLNGASGVLVSDALGVCKVGREANVGEHICIEHRIEGVQKLSDVGHHRNTEEPIGGKPGLQVLTPFPASTR